MSDFLVDAIAADLGIARITEEAEDAFAIRTLYSACRYWIESFCLDDGERGACGIAKASITRRMGELLSHIDSAYPFFKSWLEPEDGGQWARIIYNRLVDVGDLMPSIEGADKEKVRLRCAEAHGVKLPGEIVLRLGRCDVDEWPNEDNGRISSGLAIVGQSSQEEGLAVKPEELNCKWWELAEAGLQWFPANSMGDIEFANPYSRKWSIGQKDAWTESPTYFGKDGLTLAVSRGSASPEYFFAKDARSGVLLSPIRDFADAQIYYTHLKAASGHPIVVQVSEVDARHVSLKLPLWQIPQESARWIDLMSWPTEGADDRFMRIARVEILEAISLILKTCEVEIGGVQIG